MIRPWHFTPLLAGAALAAGAYWWLAEKDLWQPPPARTPELPQLAPLQQPVRSTVREALARPPLWASRRPVEADGKKGGMEQEINQSRLTAVFESGRQRIALLQRPDGSPLKLTSDTKPWRLESFDGRKALFVSEDGARRVERPLEAGSGAPKRARTAAGRP